MDADTLKRAISGPEDEGPDIPKSKAEDVLAENDTESIRDRVSAEINIEKKSGDDTITTSTGTYTVRELAKSHGRDASEAWVVQPSGLLIFDMPEDIAKQKRKGIVESWVNHHILREAKEKLEDGE